MMLSAKHYQPDRSSRHVPTGQEDHRVLQQVRMTIETTVLSEIQHGEDEDAAE